MNFLLLFLAIHLRRTISHLRSNAKLLKLRYIKEEMVECTGTNLEGGKPFNSPSVIPFTKLWDFIELHGSSDFYETDFGFKLRDEHIFSFNSFVSEIN